MLLWCALVMSSILPTRSVVETPWVLLHSLQRHRVADCRHQATLVLGLSAQKINSPVPARLFHLVIRVFPIDGQGYIIWSNSENPDTHQQASNWRVSSVTIGTCRTSVHAEVSIVLVQCLQGGHVGGPLHNLIYPFNGTHHLVSLLLGEDWRTLVLCNLTLTTRHNT